MRVTQTALASPGDWCTRQYAARKLAVSPRTIERMIEDEVLTGHSPEAAAGEKPPVMLLLAQVEEVAAARRTAGVRRRAA